MDRPDERVIETRGNREGDITFVRSDGSIIWESSLILSSLVSYTFSSVTNPPPAQSQIRANNTNVSDITELWIHRLDNDGKDRKFFIVQVKPNRYVYMQDINNSDSRVVFSIVEPPIDNGDFITLKVAFQESSGTPLQGANVLFGIFV